ncbi:MAG: hypothetical protein GF350_08755 [Chitinivibrionales bacterium]|nr:hypothetical protein [Chitinivibrionales bacterium]
MELYNRCEPTHLGKVVVPCGGEKNIFKSFLGKSYSEWQDSSSYLIKSYFHICVISYKIEGNKSNLLTDSILIDIAICFLSDTSSKRKSISDIGWKVIFEHVPYELIWKNSIKIQDALEKADFEKSKKIYAYLLTDLPDSTKAGYKEIEYLPLYLKARLGIDSAEDKLIEQYASAQSYQKKKKLVEELIYVGSEKCLKHLIKGFNEPFFAGTKRCLAESIRLPIIEGLQKHYYTVPELNEEFRIFLGLKGRKQNANNAEMVTAYLEKFKKWAKTEFGIEPEDPDPEPLLFRPCMDVLFR